MTSPKAVLLTCIVAFGADKGVAVSEQINSFESHVLPGVSRHFCNASRNRVPSATISCLVGIVVVGLEVVEVVETEVDEIVGFCG